MDKTWVWLPRASLEYGEGASNFVYASARRLGEFCSIEQTYKIGRIQLGPNEAAVIVKSVFKEEAYVWRPTPTIFTLGQAVGDKIAWPADKVVVDNDDLSTTANKTASSTDTSSNRVRIIDWTSDEVIAEGILCSTDPKEMVNNTQLGPNAAIVKVDMIIKGDAFLWRPSADMSFISDALNENIIWQIQKIQFISPREVSANRSSPTSISNTSASSKGGKQMCILLDIHNSGQRVAEGRVCSTNPADVVHFVPLGLNASKVWVEVSKIADAKVWRPNSEIQFISDAIGTTVAWPNDRLILL
ncbi:Transposase Tnp1/En/Spm-like [Arabidopsis suecica]|uniref:Transposase Tnp1/En/Spm-like n=1 Tax=Arabidopsis suecica TaxID=45249 RepID=A0A8T1ZEJ3_ARASU|nr:Transposase Tnp1/En/Spm-like [Arabidopsis suecica]